MKTQKITFLVVVRFDPQFVTNFRKHRDGLFGLSIQRIYFHITERIIGLCPFVGSFTTLSQLCMSKLADNGF
jgi:hypothetical protein